MDLILVTLLAIFALRAFKEGGLGNFVGWFLATFFLYGILKAIIVCGIMLSADGFVFPVPDDPYLHLPGAIVASLIVGVIYYRCWIVKRRNQGDAECQQNS